MALIFVCGGQHSGTATIAGLLGRHPEVLTLPHETRLLIDEPSDQAVVTLLAGWQREAMEQGRAWLCEPTARHIQVLDRVHRLFPDAAIVVPLRDPRDVALAHKRAGKPVARAARRWNKENGAACRAAADGLPIVPFRFEDLVADPHAVLATLIDAIDLPPAPAALGSIALPDERGDWITGLAPDEISLIEGECGALMEQLGYARATPEGVGDGPQPVDSRAAVA